jgi:hypothetical protein
MIRSDRRVIGATYKRLADADSFRGRCGYADDALLRIGAARSAIYASLRRSVFRGVGLWMARWNLALRRGGARVGLRGAMEVERSPRERLGGFRPRGAVREADVIDATNAWRGPAISHVIKAGERVIYPNVLRKRPSIGYLLRAACIDHRETNFVCGRGPLIRKGEFDRFIGRHVAAIARDAASVDIDGIRRSCRDCRSRLQQQRASECKHEPGEAGPRRATCSHGVMPKVYAAFRTRGSLRTDDPLGCCPLVSFII